MEEVKKQGMESLFIPYEIALALKELGFDEPCAACYGSYVHKTSNLFLNINNPVNVEILVREKTGFNRPTFYVKTPTFSQAFRWFRENYSYHHSVYYHKSSRFECRVADSSDNNLSDELFNNMYSTYEEAELECLKKLIEIVIQKLAQVKN